MAWLPGLMFKWKNVTIELARELWTAREILSCSPSEAAQIMHGANASRNHGPNTAREILFSRYRRDGAKVPSWTNYCQDVGSSKQVVSRWLNQRLQV